MSDTKQLVTRRRFIQSAVLIVGGGCAVLWFAGLQSLRPRALGLVDRIWGPARRVRRHFSYLNLDPAGVDAYVRDYEQHVGPLPRFRVWPGVVYTRYLLSTDFFRNAADESRRVQYLVLYLPGVTLCGNPLARFD